MVFGFLSRLVDSNDRELGRLKPILDAVNSRADEMEAASDGEIRSRIDTISAVLRTLEGEALKTALSNELPEILAAAREASRRTTGMRPYDEQILGAIVLHQGKIAEMRTGEGKTLVGPLGASVNAVGGRGVHVVTVNDYLARRDARWMGPIFAFMGLSIGVIAHDSSYLFDPEYHSSDEQTAKLRPVTRREAYAADVTYGTNNEFGFDYLRDNMVTELEQRVQRGHAFAIVDEVDNILIDEARTPLIISGQAAESQDLYATFSKLVPRLRARDAGAEGGGDYFLDEKEKAVSPTEDGVARVEQMLGIENLYSGDPLMARHFESALRAHALFKRDRDYIVEGGEIVIVDEFTGRKMPGRRWSEGLHQAIEAKEGLHVQRESVTLATITFQNYFRLYGKLAGMTGTAMTEAEEFSKIYSLEVTAIPTHQPMVRDDQSDLVYRTERAKDGAIVEHIKERRAAGQPVLVGTTSVERSEHLAALLKREGITHNVLNAKQHEREAPVVAQAGRSGAVTIATNMAGRGTDIVLGGNPAGLASEALRLRGLNPAEVDAATYAEALAEAERSCVADREIVLAAGGLRILGTERHESRRIDNQLRGRAGRQGDPGSSRFYLSLEDDLMKRFAGERVIGLMDRLGFDETQALESSMVSRTIEGAQTRVEGYNFDIRKRVVEFDDVINKQRATVYGERDRVLHGDDLNLTVEDSLRAEARSIVMTHCPPGLPGDWSLEALKGDLKRAGIVPPENLENIVEDAILIDAIEVAALEALNKKAAEFGPEIWPRVLRAVILRSIDQLWVEHLTEVDDLRRGIGLRGYAQEDPLNAFKREAFKLYDEFQGLIRVSIGRSILRVSVVQQEAPRPKIVATSAASTTSAPAPKAPVVAAATVGRNDPCPCGSGKKYKKCHGA
ncbi:MAG: preprotein translocase subunit SecA [Chloroflexi bacterium]|nr:preprotein translocase subunit SecA [Chloroflexota bacterium]MBJ7360032.1 preprotein translocase subunit SecA [Chloroflexota bacterium]